MISNMQVWGILTEGRHSQSLNNTGQETLFCKVLLCKTFCVGYVVTIEYECLSLRVYVCVSVCVRRCSMCTSRYLKLQGELLQ